MSLIIRNISGAFVDVDDLGIRLDINEDYNLAQDAAQDVATSDDLIIAIQASQLIVLDPLDDASPLTVSQSVEAVKAANDPHFRIRGGELSQLDDVSATVPADGYVLTYNQINGAWEPQPGGIGGSTNTCFPFFKADGTQDDIVVSAGQFPFFKADGTQDNITIQIC